MMRPLLVAILLALAGPALAQNPSNPTVTPPQITPVQIPNMIQAGPLGPDDLFVLTQKVAGPVVKYVTRKMPLSQMIGPGSTNGLAVYSGPNSITGTPLGTGTGVLAALSLAPNSTGGMALFPVSSSSLSGLGTGVASALGTAVNTAGGISTFPVAVVNLSGLGSGVAAALGTSIGTAGSPVLNGGVLGTPSSGTLTNATGLPIGGLSGLGSGVPAVLSTGVNTASGLLRLDGSAFIPTTPIVGITSGSAAAAGNIGEVIASDVPTASAVSVTASTATNITSVSLTSGAWLCWGNVVSKPAGGTLTTGWSAWLSTVSAAVPTALENGGSFVQTAGLSGNAGLSVAAGVGSFYLNVSSPTTVFLSTFMTFTTSTMGAYGYEACRRVM